MDITINQPHVSFCIITYNHERFIADAIQGALSQTYDNMEIIISDDCSTDNTYGIIQKTIDAYQGSKKVIVNKNPNNLGLVQHVNHIIQDIAKGEIIVLEGGDDISFPDRVEIAVHELEHNPRAMAVSGQRMDIDANGQPIRQTKNKYTEWLLDEDYLCSSDFMRGGACKDFRKHVFTTFGPLNDSAQTEDSTIRFRCLLLGTIIETDSVILKYRKHTNNLSHPSRIYKLSTNGIAEQYMADVKTALNKHLIDIKIANALNRKINFYKIQRLIAYKKQQNKLYGILKKVVDHIVPKLLRFRYEHSI